MDIKQEAQVQMYIEMVLSELEWSRYSDLILNFSFCNYQDHDMLHTLSLIDQSLISSSANRYLHYAALIIPRVCLDDYLYAEDNVCLHKDIHWQMMAFDNILPAVRWIYKQKHSYGINSEEPK
ncbi:hypothetical protein Q0590_30605 [Rhodocytophaga aerolata]|uniref:Uncharacterized protein n=1 Tax=Rhodocytophaga aerolata TaxID=455078 RepID=A0ABT8RFA6_9BACT|nr:hypothetical protein [Rhodocytophaga aerolata]MDO1450664.1 hypothetical protein [Rhodocytophaga aerolata]